MAIPLLPLRRSPAPPPSPKAGAAQSHPSQPGYSRLPTTSLTSSSPCPFGLPFAIPHVPRRYISLLCLLIILVPSWLWVTRSMHPFAVEDRQGRCEFVSPLAAYLRQLNGSRIGGTEGLRWKDNGEVEYDLDGAASGREDHPVVMLLERAERQWDKLNGREPRSLSEAVADYEARWGRRPPKGFDKWFAFTQKHNVLLPSTYHPLLQSSLEPFRALRPAEFARRAKWSGDFGGTFVLNVNERGQKGRVKIEMKDGLEAEWPGTTRRAKEHVAIMKPFAKELSSMRVTFSLHDKPTIYPHQKRTADLRALAKQGLYDEHASEEEDIEFLDWDKVCGRTLDPNLNGEQRPSFIYDREKFEDVCQNPSLLNSEGMYLETRGPGVHHWGHSMHFPVLATSKTAANGDILAAPYDEFINKQGRDPAWANKKSDKLVWRGSTTGIDHNPTLNWRSQQRTRFVAYANSVSPPSNSTTLLAPTVEGDSGKVPFQKLTLGQADLAEWKDWAFDVAFSGKAIQCEGKQGNKYGVGATGTCKKLRDEYRFSTRKSANEINKYKYIFDVDGNAWSSRFRRLLSTNSLVLKSSIYPEWYSQALIPWFHYVPVSSSYSDLLPILSFFRGTPSQPGAGFDAVAEAIARNGQCYVRRMWRLVDLQAYMYLVFLEMGRLFAGEEDRGGMDLPPLKRIRSS